MLKAKIIQYANKTPDRFLDVYNDKDRDVRVFIKKALDSGHIAIRNGVWKHNQNSIGISEDQVIEWFKTNTDIYALLRKSVRDGVAPTKETKKAKVTKKKKSALESIANDIESEIN